MVIKKQSYIELVRLNSIKDDTLMCVAEYGKNIPFQINRVYYMVNSKPGLPRGYHTHKELEQAFFCIQGSVRMILDNGYVKEEVIIDKPDIGVMLRPMIWHEMHDITKDTIMLVLASDKYKEDDYIREYSQFLKSVGAK